MYVMSMQGVGEDGRMQYGVSQRRGGAASRSVSPQAQLWCAGSSYAAGGSILSTRQATWAKGEARKVRKGGRGGAAGTGARQGLAGWISQAAGTSEIAVAISGRGGGGVHRCPSQTRAALDAGAERRRPEPGLSNGAGHGHRAERRARCWRRAPLHYIPYTTHTIPTLTHSSHPTHRIVAAFALPLS